MQVTRIRHGTDIGALPFLMRYQFVREGDSANYLSLTNYMPTYSLRTSWSATVLTIGIYQGTALFEPLQMSPSRE